MHVCWQSIRFVDHGLHGLIRNNDLHRLQSVGSSFVHDNNPEKETKACSCT